MASSIFERKILPSPILPVEAVFRMTSTVLDHRVVEHHLKLDLGKQVDIVFSGRDTTRVAFLASVAADLEHGHAVDADFDQRIFYSLKARWLNDGFQLGHVRSPDARAA